MALSVFLNDIARIFHYYTVDYKWDNGAKQSSELLSCVSKEGEMLCHAPVLRRSMAISSMPTLVFSTLFYCLNPFYK